MKERIEKAEKVKKHEIVKKQHQKMV